MQINGHIIAPGANLRGADLRGTYLCGANLRAVDLRGAYLCGANLRAANIRDTIIEWQSHDLIAELLMQAAGDQVDRRCIAGLVLVSRDWCWDDFAEKLTNAQRTWAVSALRPRIKPGDGAPKVLRD